MKPSDFIPIWLEGINFEQSTKAQDTWRFLPLPISDKDMERIASLNHEIEKAKAEIHNAIRAQLLEVSNRGDLVLAEGGFYDKANGVYVTDTVKIKYVNGDKQ